MELHFNSLFIYILPFSEALDDLTDYQLRSANQPALDLFKGMLNVRASTQFPADEIANGLHYLR